MTNRTGMKKEFQICVNEKIFKVNCDESRSLINVLREDLRLTGTKRGCDIGVCGSCTVLIDGRPKRACKVQISDVAALTEADGTSTGGHENIANILTIEGLENNGKLHPIQEAFIECGAIQCGFCTPGMVLAAKALLDVNPNPSRTEIKKALAVNLCRCTGYQQIFDAIEKAAKVLSTPKATKNKK